jgi:CHASE2 domain-containing sensor protein
MAGRLKAILEGDFRDTVLSPLVQRVGYAARSYRRVFYVGFATLVALAIGLNALWEAVATDLKSRSLDFAVRARLSSPIADPMIVILDVDERSLAQLSEKFGRWPWPRSVLAEAIATLEEKGARAIVLNVMMSDADKANPDGDRAFQEVAASAEHAVFPMIRLNPANDATSDVLVKHIPGAVFLDSAAMERRIAVLLPVFAGTHDKLGVANLEVDDDGAVRRHAPWWNEAGFRLPSIALRAISTAGLKFESTERVVDKGFILNWRNKRGEYRRVSFADAFASMNGEEGFDLETLRDAIVVIGVSAPGIATVKGTAAWPLTDDNVILATAIDDLKHGTHLRTLPLWASSIVSLLFVGAMAWWFYVGVSDSVINRWFGVGQSLFVLLTIGSVSFTNYLVDLSDSFFFGFGFFVVAKLYAIIDHNASRGMPAYAAVSARADRDRMLLIGFSTRQVTKADLAGLRDDLERRVGVDDVFLLDNAFGDGHLFDPVCKGWNFLVVLTAARYIRDEAQAGSVSILSRGEWTSIGDLMGKRGLQGWLRVADLPTEAGDDPLAVQRVVGEQLIQLSAEMLQARA